MEDSIKNIGAAFLLEKVSSNIVNASKMTEQLVSLAVTLMDAETIEAAIKNYYDYMIVAIPQAIEQKKVLGIDYSRDVELLASVHERIQQESYTLDDILKQIGISTDGNRER